VETILLLVHTEAGGGLGRPALEALSAARELGGVTAAEGDAGQTVEA
jgi:hypothetical protein